MLLRREERSGKGENIRIQWKQHTNAKIPTTMATIVTLMFIHKRCVGGYIQSLT